MEATDQDNLSFQHPSSSPSGPHYVNTDFTKQKKKTLTLGHFTSFPMGLRPSRGGGRKQILGYPRSILGIARYVGISAFQETEIGDKVEVTVRATVTPDGEFDT